MNKESNEQHTPGPWTIPHFVTAFDSREKPTVHGETHAPQCVCGYVFADAQRGMGSICDVRFGGENEPLEIAVANARLIAAAPELLAALQKLMPFCDEGDVEIETEWQRAVADARAAIAKATTDSSIPPDPAGGA
jgi:hypothetical protein